MSWNEEIKKTFHYAGKHVFIGEDVKFLAPQFVDLQGRVRIDPFTLITTKLVTRRNVQIMSHVVLSGGAEQSVRLGNWTFIGYGSKLFTASEDYSGDTGPVNDFWGRNAVRRGDIEFKDYAGVASDVIVMPGVTLPEGCCIGAKSFVYSDKDLEPWAVYVGSPLTMLKYRNKSKVLEANANPNYWRSR